MSWSRRATFGLPLVAAGCAGRREHTAAAGGVTRLYAGRFACDFPKSWLGGYECLIEHSPWEGFEATDEQLVLDKWLEEKGRTATLKAYPSKYDKKHVRHQSGDIDGHLFQISWDEDGDSTSPTSYGHVLLQPSTTNGLPALWLEQFNLGPRQTSESMLRAFADRVRSLPAPDGGPGIHTPSRKLGVDYQGGETVILDVSATGLDFSVEYGRVQGREYAEYGAPRMGRVARWSAHFEPAHSGVLTRLLWRRAVRYAGLLGTEVAWLADNSPGGSIHLAWSYRGPGGEKTGPFALIDVFADLGHHKRSDVRKNWFATMNSLQYLG